MRISLVIFILLWSSCKPYIINVKGEFTKRLTFPIPIKAYEIVDGVVEETVDMEYCDLLNDLNQGIHCPINPQKLNMQIKKLYTGLPVSTFIHL